ncbi:hypothetical protein PENSPDRAFT_186877 [Peniophora sp. CONT]|nr:hypothetical protein PENSPDRAFT_186877 [Peniophora sp. CONT]
MLLTRPTHPEIGFSRFTTIVELLQDLRDALAEHLEEYQYGLGKLESANLQLGSDLCVLDCVEDSSPRKQIMCNIPPMFMSGEELGGEACSFFFRERIESQAGSVLDLSKFLHAESKSKVKDAASNKIAPLCPDLSHDLESFFWVLLWLCIYRGGPARERTLKLHGPDFESEDDLIATIEWATKVFEE